MGETGTGWVSNSDSGGDRDSERGSVANTISVQTVVTLCHFVKVNRNPPWISGEARDRRRVPGSGFRDPSR
jgi:hypothetical protein